MCPALFLFGELDTQVPAEINRMTIADTLQTSGNNDYTLKIIPKANHMFQSANTGSPSEYMSLEKKFIPQFFRVYVRLGTQAGRHCYSMRLIVT